MGKSKISQILVIAASILVAVILSMLFCQMFCCHKGKRIYLKEGISQCEKNNNLITDQAHQKERFSIAISAIISPEGTTRMYTKLAGLIGEKMGEETEIVRRKTYQEVNELLKEGAVEIALVCSGPYVKGHDDFGMEILAVPMVNGKTTYCSYIITAADSPISEFKELRGKKFAFTDPNSNTGYLVPMHMLGQLGMTEKDFFKETFFTYSHDKSIEAVAEKLADAAAVDSLIWDALNQSDTEHTSRTKIIAVSPEYGIPPVVASPNMNPEKKEKIKNILLSLHEDEKGNVLLKELNIDRFVPGDDRDYDSVRKMQKWFNNNSQR